MFSVGVTASRDSELSGNRCTRLAESSLEILQRPRSSDKTRCLLYKTMNRMSLLQSRAMVSDFSMIDSAARQKGVCTLVHRVIFRTTRKTARRHTSPHQHLVRTCLNMPQGQDVSLSLVFEYRHPCDIKRGYSMPSSHVS